jgi:hypothetical protein
LLAYVLWDYLHAILSHQEQTQLQAEKQHQVCVITSVAKHHYSEGLVQTQLLHHVALFVVGGKAVRLGAEVCYLLPATCYLLMYSNQSHFT